MKILIIADVHNRPIASRRAHNKTIKGIKNAIDNIRCDLIVFLGDTVHGPDFRHEGDYDYEKYLREVLDLTGTRAFAYVFGNHDDECQITRDDILKLVDTYPNSVTRGRNYCIELCGETLLFIDSGSYYKNQDESLYDTVKKSVIEWAKKEIKGRKAILFQHIIMPELVEECMEIRQGFTLSKKWVNGTNGTIMRIKEDIEYTGNLKEYPCPPDISTDEFKSLAPNLKGAVFGHDHVNTFEFEHNGVRIIQCGGAGSNSYDWNVKSNVKLLDTETMTTETIYI